MSLVVNSVSLATYYQLAHAPLIWVCPARLPASLTQKPDALGWVVVELGRYTDVSLPPVCKVYPSLPASLAKASPLSFSELQQVLFTGGFRTGPARSLDFFIDAEGITHQKLQEASLMPEQHSVVVLVSLAPSKQVQACDASELARFRRLSADEVQASWLEPT